MKIRLQQLVVVTLLAASMVLSGCATNSYQPDAGMPYAAQQPFPGQQPYGMQPGMMPPPPPPQVQQSSGPGLGTIIGTTIAGVAGAAISGTIKNPSNFEKIAIPLGSALVGAGGGYVIDKWWGNKKQAEANARYQHQYAAYQQANAQYAADQQFKEVQRNTQLRCTVTVIMPQDTARYTVHNGAQLANVLRNVQPGQQITIIVRNTNEKILHQDMQANGYYKVSVTKYNHEARQVRFQKIDTQQIQATKSIVY